MSKYRNNLPQMSSKKFLTDSGLETTLVFHDEIDLPHFAAFKLLTTTEGRSTITEYLRRHAKIAAAHGVGFILESPTWRSNPDWAAKLGYSATELDVINRDAISIMRPIRDEYETDQTPFVMSGQIGPRDDGYNPEAFMTSKEAKAYHSAQIKSFEAAGADMVTALTMTYAEEAIGIVKASQDVGIPVAISFTVETDGLLPSTQSLHDAITQVDSETDGYAAYFMINCAHPDHFEKMLEGDGTWKNRILGVRANASRCSHAELDEAEELDDGNPKELGSDYSRLAAHLPNLRVYGGCCGTDHRHIEAIASACL